MIDPLGSMLAICVHIALFKKTIKKKHFSCLNVIRLIWLEGEFFFNLKKNNKLSCYNI